VASLLKRIDEPCIEPALWQTAGCLLTSPRRAIFLLA